MKFYIKTLGCKQNHYESELLRELFQDNGHIFSTETPDIIIIHSCAVTNRAEYKTRDIMRRSLRKYPFGKIIVIGCSAQYNREKYYEMGAYKVLDNNEKFDLGMYKIDGLSGNYADMDKRMVRNYCSQTRPYVSIQDGCNYNCAYCIITKLRGASYSKSQEKIINEVENYIKQGKKEIVLTGINIGLWGREFGNCLTDLLVRLLRYKELRIRLSSLDTNQVNDEIIDLVTENNNIMPHLHISLQTGSNNLLAMYRRHYKVEKFIEITKKIHKKDQNVRIGIDIITGLYGETDDDFKTTLETLKSSYVDYMHIFRYSVRSGTDGENFEIVNGNIAKERRKTLQELDKKFRKHSLEENLKRDHKVVVENKIVENNYHLGLTENYIEIGIKSDKINGVLLFHPEKIIGGRLYGREIKF